MKAVKFIFKLLIKLLCSLLIVILLFVEKILMLVATAIHMISGLIFLAGILLGIFDVMKNGFKVSVLLLPVGVAFVGFVLPYIAVSVPVTLGIIREKMTCFVLGE